jgi:uncharacterized protein
MESTVDVDTREPAARWEAWREARRRGVTAETGPLRLVETTWLPDGAEVDVDAVRADRPERVTVTELHRDSAETGRPEHGFRVWDPESAGMTAFAGIDAFPYDPAWVLRGWFVPVDDGRTIPYEHLRDGAGVTRGHVVPGDILVEVDGRGYTLAGFDDGDALVVVFGDPTNRTDDPEQRSYPTGRFLRVRRPADGSGPVELDFNRAYIPPCGFSDWFNCPLPPAQNRLDVAVLAGERSVVRR